ncbi:histidine--tRNA ligase [Candidatus Jorgensenbacteria bacterium]|nr:histidine--tRNA ligase [Candidatus Jorgensenbacteria bacterium]
MPNKKEKIKTVNKKKQRGPRVELPQSLRGMSDILPKDELWWKTVWHAGETVSELHNFSFIETPIVEPAALFELGVGASTDIIEKEMYTFRTKGGERVSLRPEGTAPVMRSFLEHHLGYFASPLKAYYVGPMFRYERPQAGRERQHHQWGFEIIGDSDPLYDAQVIIIALDFFKALKLKDITLKINSIGCRVCRPTYKEKLKNYYQSERAKLCRDCERRLEMNPLRLLDCKEEGCRLIRARAPIILDYLCQGCNNHLKSVLELVEDNSINYEPDPYLVRGLDYYSRTVFELVHASSGLALAGGGRYDYLSEILSGRSVPAVGVALGLERIIDTMIKSGNVPHFRTKPKIFFTAVGEQAKKASLRIMSELRSSGIVVVEALGKKSLKAQLKLADKIKAPLALIFGQREVFEKTVIVRNMESGAQETVVIDRLVEEVKKRLKS